MTLEPELTGLDQQYINGSQERKIKNEGRMVELFAELLKCIGQDTGSKLLAQLYLLTSSRSMQDLLFRELREQTSVVNPLEGLERVNNFLPLQQQDKLNDYRVRVQETESRLRVLEARIISSSVELDNFLISQPRVLQFIDELSGLFKEANLNASDFHHLLDQAQQQLQQESQQRTNEQNPWE